MSHSDRLPIQIRKLRRERKLTLKQVCEKTGLSEPQLSQIEHGKRRVLAVEAKAIADVLGVQVDDLFTDTDSPAASSEPPEAA